MKANLNFIASSLLGVCATTIPALALADDSYLLDSSVVTASGFAQDVKEAPASISIITKEELESKPIRDIGDAISDIPGVEVSKTKLGSSTISMRGFESKYTLILIDGKRQNTSDAFSKNGYDVNASFMPPLSMIDRIEVIRGPASTIYGSDAIGGVVNIITKKHTDEITGNIGADYLAQEHSEYGNAYGLNGFVNIPIIAKTLSMSLHAKQYDNDGSELKYPNGEYAGHSAGEFNLQNVGGSIFYTVNEKNDLKLEADEYFEEGTTNNTTSAGIKSTSNYRRHNYVLSHMGHYDFGESTSYLQYIGTSQENGTTLESESYIANTKWVTPFDLGDFGALNLNSGLEFWHERFRDDANSSVSDIAGRDLIQNQTSGFLEGEYFITDNLIYTLGGRYTYGSIFGGHVTPRTYLVYKFTDELSVKGGVAGGYKVPSVKELTAGLYENNSRGANPRYGNPDLEPETSWNYELSIDYTKPELGSITVTGFLTDFKDKLAYDDYDVGASLPNGQVCNPSLINGKSKCSIRSNIDKTRSQGIELLLSTASFYGVSLSGSYTFTETEQRSGSRIGKPVAEIPRHNIMVKVNYNYNDFNTYLKYTSKLDTPYVSSKGKAPFEYYKDIYLLDLGFNYTLNKKHHFNFVINNLLDEDFAEYYESSADSYTSVYSDYLEGRSFYFSYNMDF